MKLFNRKKRKKIQVTEPKMYVLVRNDLAPGLQMAQACHAAAYLAAENALLLYQHPTMIVLGVSKDELYNESLKNEGFIFIEPDLGYEETAFACYSTGEEYAHLKRALN